MLESSGQRRPPKAYRVLAQDQPRIVPRRIALFFLRYADGGNRSNFRRFRGAIERATAGIDVTKLAETIDFENLSSTLAHGDFGLRQHDTVNTNFALITSLGIGPPTNPVFIL